MAGWEEYYGARLWPEVYELDSQCGPNGSGDRVVSSSDSTWARVRSCFFWIWDFNDLMIYSIFCLSDSDLYLVKYIRSSYSLIDFTSIFRRTPPSPISRSCEPSFMMAYSVCYGGWAAGTGASEISAPLMMLWSLTWIWSIRPADNSLSKSSSWVSYKYFWESVS